MKFPEWLPVYGDKSYRGKCRKEQSEQIDVFAWLRLHHPELAAIAIHPKMEGKRTYGQAHFDKKEGSINKGASDIIIPASPPFICELKRKDHMKCKWQEGQLEYLENSKALGAFVCVALGFEGFKTALDDYIESINLEKRNVEK